MHLLFHILLQNYKNLYLNTNKIYKLYKKHSVVIQFIYIVLVTQMLKNQ
jgi:hypothetical protein